MPRVPGSFLRQPGGLLCSWRRSHLPSRAKNGPQRRLGAAQLVAALPTDGAALLSPLILRGFVYGFPDPRPACDYVSGAISDQHKQQAELPMHESALLMVLHEAVAPAVQLRLDASHDLVVLLSRYVDIGSAADFRADKLRRTSAKANPLHQPLHSLPQLESHSAPLAAESSTCSSTFRSQSIAQVVADLVTVVAAKQRSGAEEDQKTREMIARVRLLGCCTMRDDSDEAMTALRQELSALATPLPVVFVAGLLSIATPLACLELLQHQQRVVRQRCLGLTEQEGSVVRRSSPLLASTHLCSESEFALLWKSLLSNDHCFAPRAASWSSTNGWSVSHQSGEGASAEDDLDERGRCMGRVLEWLAGTLPVAPVVASVGGLSAKSPLASIDWTALLNKTSRVFSKTARGFELLDVHQQLVRRCLGLVLRAPPEYPARVVGAILDEVQGFTNEGDVPLLSGRLSVSYAASRWSDIQEFVRWSVPLVVNAASHSAASTLLHLTRRVVMVLSTEATCAERLTNVYRLFAEGGCAMPFDKESFHQLVRHTATALAFELTTTTKAATVGSMHWWGDQATSGSGETNASGDVLLAPLSVEYGRDAGSPSHSSTPQPRLNKAVERVWSRVLYPLLHLLERDTSAKFQWILDATVQLLSSIATPQASSSLDSAAQLEVRVPLASLLVDFVQQSLLEARDVSRVVVREQPNIRRILERIGAASPSVFWWTCGCGAPNSAGSPNCATCLRRDRVFWTCGSCSCEVRASRVASCPTCKKPNPRHAAAQNLSLAVCKRCQSVCNSDGVCPTCTSSTSAGARPDGQFACPSCAAPLRQDLPVCLTCLSPNPRSKMRLWACSHCGEHTYSIWSQCPACSTPKAAGTLTIPPYVWACGCGTRNHPTRRQCSSCSSAPASHDGSDADTRPARTVANAHAPRQQHHQQQRRSVSKFTCGICKQQSGLGVRWDVLGVDRGNASAPPYRVTLCEHCHYPHPHDEWLLRQPKALARLCLSCGQRFVPKQSTSDGPQVCTHCCSLQTFNPNIPFQCHSCDRPAGQAGAQDADGDERNVQSRAVVPWQWGTVECSACHVERDDLDHQAVFVWKCVNAVPRSEDASTAQAEEGGERSAIATSFSRTNSSASETCETWNPSWARSCRSCGAARVNCDDEVRARYVPWVCGSCGVTHDATTVLLCPNCDGGMQVPPECDQCGLVHVSLRCPTVEQLQEAERLLSLAESDDAFAVG